VAPLLPALRHRPEGPGALLEAKHRLRLVRHRQVSWGGVGGMSQVSKSVNSCVTGVAGTTGGMRILRSQPSLLPNRVGGILPPPSDRARINARQAELRKLGKAAVHQLCERLGVHKVPTNFTCMIVAATNAEELRLKAAEEREGQEGGAGNACFVTGICWYVTVHSRRGRHE
jgi:hypothetical protein